MQNMQFDVRMCMLPCLLQRHSVSSRANTDSDTHTITLSPTTFANLQTT